MGKSKHKYNSIILFIILIVIILTVIIIVYSSYKPKKPIGLVVHYYKDGVEVIPEKTFIKQSIITPPREVYDAISFSIYGSNDNDLAVTDMQIVEASPTQLFSTLPTSEIQSLEPNEQNKLLWNSGIITTKQFEGENQPVTFYIRVSGKLTGSEIYFVEDLINLIIEGDLVIFRTNVEPGQSSNNFFGTWDSSKTSDGNLRWIAVDRNNDEILESYGYSFARTGLNDYCDINYLNVPPYPIILYVEQDCYRLPDCANPSYWIVSSGDAIGVCINTAFRSLNVRWYREGQPGSELGITYNKPIEPYKSENCGGAFQCQERYGSRINDPIPTCSDNYLNQDETDIDCGGLNCAGCDYGDNCIDNSDCLGLSICTGGTCEATEFVSFRTSHFCYDEEAGSSYAVGYTDNCGSPLIKYGRVSDSHASSNNCETIYRERRDCTNILGTSDCLLFEYNGCIINKGKGYEGDGIWKMYQTSLDESRIILCQDDIDGNGFKRIELDFGDLDKDLVDDYPAFDYSTPELQVKC